MTFTADLTGILSKLDNEPPQPPKRVLALVSDPALPLPQDVAVLAPVLANCGPDDGGGAGFRHVRRLEKGEFDLRPLMEDAPWDVIVDLTRLDSKARTDLLGAMFPLLAGGGVYMVCNLAKGVAGAANKVDPLRAQLSELTTRFAMTPPPREYGRILHDTEPLLQVWHYLDAVTFHLDRVLLRKWTGDNPPFRRYVRRPFAELATEWTEIVPAMTYERADPLMFDTPDFMIERMRSHIDFGQPYGPAGCVGTLRDAVIYSDGTACIGDRWIVDESLINIRSMRIIPFFRKVSETDYMSLGWNRPRTIIKERNTFLFKQHWDGNYGHYLFETLPRIGLLAKKYDLKECHYIVTAWFKPFIPLIYETLQFLGIPEKRIILTSGDPIDVPELIYATPMAVHPFYKHPFVTRFLERLGETVRAAVTQPSVPAPKKIYFSRNHRAGRRQLLNEAEVTCALERRGYHIVYQPEKLTFAEQVCLMTNARMVAGNLGAALSNAVFAPQGVRMLALSASAFADDFFWDFVSQKGGAYYSLHGRDAGTELGGKHDFSVNISRFLEVLEAFEAGDRADAIPLR